MIVISVIMGSVREGRFSEKPARWILQHLKTRDGVDARLLDLRDFPLVDGSPEESARQRAVMSARDVEVVHPPLVRGK
jgi:NAD(P)H-dependent FMN reductase